MCVFFWRGESCFSYVFGVIVWLFLGTVLLFHVLFLWLPVFFFGGLVLVSNLLW